MKFLFIFYTFLLINSPIIASEKSTQPPALLLARIYHENINLHDYWVSEKLDGVRAFWNGKQLISRKGNIYHAPFWFTSVLPDIALDGELWISKGKFDELSAIVRRHSSTTSDWSTVSYRVFDLPGSPNTFDHRLKQLKTIIQKVNAPHIQLVHQHRIADHESLIQLLDKTVAEGGEGLMLHRGSSVYQSTRSDDLLKLKKYLDAEAIVIAHLPGNGKYTGMLGSLEVETKDHIRFKIGTGFSDAERKSPPPVGSVITYKYYGFTNKGTPRFASFVRIRNVY